MDHYNDYYDDEEEIDLEEIYLEIVHETDLAYLLSDGFTKNWVPKSLIRHIEGSTNRGDICLVSLPLWVAEQKGFA